MDETRFWAVIEEAWQTAGKTDKGRQKLADARRKLVERGLSDAKAEALAEVAQEKVIPALQAALGRLPADELMAFDRVLERKLYDIDRADIQEQTDGSDDGFLYARGFIVVAGRGYYEAVHARPAAAYMDLECEEMCYLSWHLYEETFGEMPRSGISRESCTNQAGWPGHG